MPNDLRAFHPDAKFSPGGDVFRRRAIAHIQRIPFWWLGEREVVKGGPDPGSADRTVIAFRQWNVDEYTRERGRELVEHYPILSGFDGYFEDGGPFTFTSEEACELGRVLAEISNDDAVPGAASLKMVSRFLAIAAERGCFVRFAG